MKTSKLMVIAALFAFAGTSFIEAKKIVSKKTQKRHKAAKAAESKRIEIEAELLKMESDALLAIDAYNWSISSATAIAAKKAIDSFILYINQRNSSLKSDNGARKKSNKNMRTAGSSAGVVTEGERKKIKNNNEIIKKNKAMIHANNNTKRVYTQYLEDIKNNVAIEVKTQEEIQALPTIKEAFKGAENAVKKALVKKALNGAENTTNITVDQTASNSDDSFDDSDLGFDDSDLGFDDSDLGFEA